MRHYDALGGIAVFTRVNKNALHPKKDIYLIPGSPLEVIGIFKEDHFCGKRFRSSNLMVHITPYIKKRKHKNM